MSTTSLAQRILAQMKTYPRRQARSAADIAAAMVATEKRDVTIQLAILADQRLVLRVPQGPRKDDLWQLSPVFRQPAQTGTRSG